MNVTQVFDDEYDIDFDAYLEKYGVTDIEQFLRPNGKGLDHYSQYENIRDAVNLIKYHYLNGNKVYILSDSGDVDGVTSACIMYDYLKRLNKDWKVIILVHKGKERGLQDDELFEKLLNDKDDKLLIIPDSGTNDKDRVNELYSYNNIDVLVADHHNLDTPIEQGVLVNNQMGNVSKYGSGCLVTHKVLQALDAEFNKHYSKDYIDIVALSLVADIMNMSDLQNRTYYYFGLEKIDRVKNPFLRQLIEDYIGDKEYTQRDIAFKVVPKLNAVSRSSNQKLKQKVFKAFLGLADVGDVSLLCKDAHAEQVKIVNDIVEQNVNDIDYSDKLIVVANDTIQRNYAGLIASKLSNGHPIIVGRIHGDNLIGSFRSPIDIDDTLVNNPLINWKRGHVWASGIELPAKNIQPLVDYYNNLEELPQPTTTVLYSCPVSKIPHKVFEDFNKYPNIYGQGLPTPKLHVYNIKFNSKDIQVLGSNERTLKLQCKGIACMWFMATNKTKEQLLDCKGEQTLEVIGTMNINEFRGTVTHQIIVEDFEVHDKSFDDLF